MENVQAAAELAARIRGELAKAIVGQREVVDRVLASLIAAGHVLLEGVPGVGKTLVARALAKTFGGSTTRVQHDARAVHARPDARRRRRPRSLRRRERDDAPAQGPRLHTLVTGG